jgi:hypothetical protein
MVVPGQKTEVARARVDAIKYFQQAVGEEVGGVRKGRRMERAIIFPECTSLFTGMVIK